MSSRRDSDHFVGCLLGGAVGDALGAPIEFMSTDEIRAKFGVNGITDYSPSYGRLGAITDDTQMTLFTAEGLLRAECQRRRTGRNEATQAIHHAYIRWLHTQGLTGRHAASTETDDGWLIGVNDLHARRAPGRTCLSGLESPRMGTIEDPLNGSKGCGGVMRVAPIGLFCAPPKEAFDLACEAAAITHGHPSGFYSAGCLAAIISDVTNGKELLEAIEDTLLLLESPGNKRPEECANAIRGALAFHRDERVQASPEVIERMGGGWVGEEALAISIYCALASGDEFGRGVLLAVNHSGDSDSTGAIAGNILGALLGAAAIPARWKDGVELRAEIETLAVDLFAGFADDDAWSRKYPVS